MADIVVPAGKFAIISVIGRGPDPDGVDEPLEDGTVSVTVVASTDRVVEYFTEYNHDIQTIIFSRCFVLRIDFFKFYFWLSSSFFIRYINLFL